ncbi:hypothetical protein E2320_019200, partial [Naja naja]
MPTQHRSAA